MRWQPASKNLRHAKVIRQNIMNYLTEYAIWFIVNCFSSITQTLGHLRCTNSHIQDTHSLQISPDHFFPVDKVGTPSTNVATMSLWITLECKHFFAPWFYFFQFFFPIFQRKFFKLQLTSYLNSKMLFYLETTKAVINKKKIMTASFHPL